MDFSDNISSIIRKQSEIINGVFDIKGTIPAIGIVANDIYASNCTIEDKNFSIVLSVLTVPAVGDLITLSKKLDIAVNSEPESIKETGALGKAKNIKMLFGILHGNVKTGAIGVKKTGNAYMQKTFSNIKNKAKKDKNIEFISNKHGHVYNKPDEWVEMRVCTDGKMTAMMAKNEKYGDDDHQNSTAYFGNTISADMIPYIVIPVIEDENSKKNNKKKKKKKEEDMSIYVHSLGVIVDKKGNYLYCVVAEAGLKSNGMGEMSIYAAWRMKKLDTSFDVTKEIELDKDYIIAGDNRETKGKKYKFILFAESAPNSKATRSGWESKPKKLYNQIIEIGNKCYKGTGKCLN